jgi:acyl-CoA synthetase (AMP-forming)/AMP-acid ligase II
MLVPVQYKRIMELPEFDQFDLSSMKAKFSTSAPLRADIKHDVLKRFPGGLTEYYGLTEGGGVTVLSAHEHPDKLHTVGQPGPGVELRLIDETGKEVAPGAVGEICGRSGAMMAGYYGRDDLTEATLWRDERGRIFFRSGDMGSFDKDGFLVLSDRKKDMIISGGLNIYANDLELVLLADPDVTDAAVVGVPSEEWGETPLGFVVLRPGARRAAADILADANAKLGKSQRLSNLVIREALPRSDIGKILKRELRLEYLA